MGATPEFAVLEQSFPQFVPVTVLKRDIFSETISGHMRGEPEVKLVLRRLDAVPIYARPIAQFLARKEIRGLRAVQGIAGTPILMEANRAGILRGWSEGTPLDLARPDMAAWYRDAKRLLREMRRAGVTHNDIAKPQNWLMTPEGRAAVIDFQLASVHRRKSRMFMIMAREDLRHLLKQKRSFAPGLLTPSERRLLARKSLPSRVWMATGKRVYNFVTRKLMNWSDNEGAENRMAVDAPRIHERLMSHADISEVVICPFSLPANGIGLYAFVEGTADEETIRGHLSPGQVLEHVQPVAELPRRGGVIADDLLHLIATNRIDEMAQMVAENPDIADVATAIITTRRNLTDRILRK